MPLWPVETDQIFPLALNSSEGLGSMLTHSKAIACIAGQQILVRSCACQVRSESADFVDAVAGTAVRSLRDCSLPAAAASHGNRRASTLFPAVHWPPGGEHPVLTSAHCAIWLVDLEALLKALLSQDGIVLVQW